MISIVITLHMFFTWEVLILFILLLFYYYCIFFKSLTLYVQEYFILIGMFVTKKDFFFYTKRCQLSILSRNQYFLQEQQVNKRFMFVVMHFYVWTRNKRQEIQSTTFLPHFITYINITLLSSSGIFEECFFNVTEYCFYTFKKCLFCIFFFKQVINFFFKNKIHKKKKLNFGIFD